MGEFFLEVSISKLSNTLNMWQFNVNVPDDKQVSSELKRSLEGRIPQSGQPVTLEIQMETQEVKSDL